MNSRQRRAFRAFQTAHLVPDLDQPPAGWRRFAEDDALGEPEPTPAVRSSQEHRELQIGQRWTTPAAKPTRH